MGYKELSVGWVSATTRNPRLPASARIPSRLAEMVVLPTPPFVDQAVTTIMATFGGLDEGVSIQRKACQLEWTENPRFGSSIVSLAIVR